MIQHEGTYAELHSTKKFDAIGLNQTTDETGLENVYNANKLVISVEYALLSNLTSILDDYFL